MQRSTRWSLREPRDSINVRIYRYEIFTPIHQIVNYKYVKNICFGVTLMDHTVFCVSRIPHPLTCHPICYSITLLVPISPNSLSCDPTHPSIIPILPSSSPLLLNLLRMTPFIRANPIVPYYPRVCYLFRVID